MDQPMRRYDQLRTTVAGAGGQCRLVAEVQRVLTGSVSQPLNHRLSIGRLAGDVERRPTPVRRRVDVDRWLT